MAAAVPVCSLRIRVVAMAGGGRRRRCVFWVTVARCIQLCRRLQSWNSIWLTVEVLLQCITADRKTYHVCIRQYNGVGS